MATTTESALLRATQAHRLLLSESESLDWGIAYTSERFANVTTANQFREIIIEGETGFETVFDAVEDYYAQRGLTCHSWAPAVDQDVGPFDAFLSARGFDRRDDHAMLVRQWASVEATGDIRVLPARAMRKTLTTVLEERFGSGEEHVQSRDAVIERLDDASLNGLVATKDGMPAGYAMFFEVGDIGCVTDVYVVRETRRRGVGTALVDHALKLARRLALRVSGARVPRKNEAAVALFGKLGMAPDGTLTEFVRSGSG